MDARPATLALTLSLAAAVGAALAGPARADHLAPPAPGNLVANGGFDAGTAGWGSYGGSLAWDPSGGSECLSHNLGSVVVRQRSGPVYTISDTQGGNRPTVASVTAGETYIAYVESVQSVALSAVGKPMRLILRERNPSTNAIVKESAVSWFLDSDWSRYRAVSHVAVRTGDTLDLRIEQSGAEPGDAFRVDGIFLRRASNFLGSPTGGAIWTRMSADTTRVSHFPGDDHSRWFDRVRVLIDGKGATSGSQKLRLVWYQSWGPLDPSYRLAVSLEQTIVAGSGPRWVEFRFGAPLHRSGYDGSGGFLGLQSSGTAGVARYAASAVPGGLLFAPDRYADGAAPDFPLPFSVDDKRISLYGIGVPIGPSHPGSCW